MSESIVQLVDGLPADNITVKALKALDFVVPGQWENLVGFDSMIRSVTGTTDPGRIQRIRDRAIALYQDPNEPYQFTTRLYRTIDRADTAIATAALANKVGEKVSFLSVLNKLTPKADILQTVDLVLKVAVELIAFSKLNGIPQPNPSAFASSLSQNYTGSALMRMVALVCFDGILPLGPDFLNKVHSIIDNASPSTLQQNPVFQSVGGFIPGEGDAGKLAFIRQSFNSAQGWMSNLVQKSGVTPQSIFNHLGNAIQISDDNLDFVAAFVDQATNYYEHTGIQTIAQNLIVRANTLVGDERTPLVSQAVQSPNIAPERIGADGQYNQSGLAQRVEQAFKKHPQMGKLNSVWVAQAGTTVVLKGRVPSRADLDRLIAIARAEKGCTGVNSEQVTIG